MLLEFLNEHPYLASGSKEKTKDVEPWERERLWEEAAAKLNAKGPAVKTRYAWRKFWSGRSAQIKRTVARIAKMREESKMPPRLPPPPPAAQPPPEAGQFLLLVKPDGGSTGGGRLLLPRPVPQPPPQQQVLLHVGDPTTMFMATDCSTMQTTTLPAEVTTTRGGTVQQPVVGRGRVLVEQPASANANRRGPPVLQRHVLANGQPPPDPDSIPVLEPITAEEHFHAEMLHQTIRQTALLQDMLGAQQRIAEAAERQAQAAEDQSHALSQLVLFLVENHRSNRNSGTNLSASVVDDSSCPEATTPLSITPEMLQVEHST